MVSPRVGSLVAAVCVVQAAIGGAGADGTDAALAEKAVQVGDSATDAESEGDVIVAVTDWAALDTALFRATSSQRLWVSVSSSFSNCRNSEIMVVLFVDEAYSSLNNAQIGKSWQSCNSITEAQFYNLEQLVSIRKFAFF